MQGHGYGLRDRSKVAKPSHTAQTLLEKGQIIAYERTYGRNGRGRCGGTKGKVALRDWRWNMVRATNLDWLGLHIWRMRY